MVDANPIHIWLTRIQYTCQLGSVHMHLRLPRVRCIASHKQAGAIWRAQPMRTPFQRYAAPAREVPSTPLCPLAGRYPNSFYYASRKTLPNGCVTFLHHRQRPLSQAPVAERPVVLPPATKERAMPIRPFLDGHIFDPETTRLMGICIRNGSCGSSSTPPSPPHRQSNRREDHRACEIRRAQCRCFV